ARLSPRACAGGGRAQAGALAARRPVSGEQHRRTACSRPVRAQPARALVIDTPSMGRVTVGMVGAIIVGRITVTALGGDDTRPGIYPLQPAVKVQQGDEIGVFHLGSTAVLFVEPGVALSHDLGPIRYGEAF